MEKTIWVILIVGCTAIFGCAAYFGVLLWVIGGYTVLGLALWIASKFMPERPFNEEDDAQLSWCKGKE